MSGTAAATGTRRGIARDAFWGTFHAREHLARRSLAEQFDEVDREPVEPACSVHCPFREFCPTWVQLGAISLFTSRLWPNLDDCFWWQERTDQIRREFGSDVVLPTSADEFRELLGRTRATREPGE